MQGEGGGPAGQGDASLREKSKWYLVGWVGTQLEASGMSTWSGGADAKPQGTENLRTQRSRDRAQTPSRAALTLFQVGGSPAKVWARE